MQLVLVLDNIRSLYNVGSMFRTADGLGVAKLFLCGYTGTPDQHGVQKVALGAEQSVPWEKFETTAGAIEQLRADGYAVVGLELAEGAVELSRFAADSRSRDVEKMALVVGNEVEGLLPETLSQLDAAVMIPMRGTKESFNVAVAASLAMYELLK